LWLAVGNDFSEDGFQCRVVILHRGLGRHRHEDVPVSPRNREVRNDQAAGGDDKGDDETREIEDGKGRGWRFVQLSLE
jgi:hypothetical protein